MLEYLQLANVGPAVEMELEFGKRMNLITGDNGLGKSFLLDVAWWALTQRWAGRVVMPHMPPALSEIGAKYTSTQGSFSFVSEFLRNMGTWETDRSRPPVPGLILYAHVDGGFSVWDPARNHWRFEPPERVPDAYVFTTHELWEGNLHCEGLIRDWASWQREHDETFEVFTRVLRALSPSDAEPLEAGDLQKISFSDPKRYPSLRTPYGADVAIVHASAGMRRIAALAYLLVWAWQEHVAAAKLRGTAPVRDFIFLVDEVECHLHPQWQRRIVPALLEVVSALVSKGTKVQLVASTHSPLVMASVEPLFDDERDAWFDLDLVDGQVKLTRREFERRGDASKWLTSEAFDLAQARSVPAEQAMERALALLRTPSPKKDAIRKVDSALRDALPGLDPFWVRWSYFVEQQLGPKDPDRESGRARPAKSPAKKGAAKKGPTKKSVLKKRTK